MNEPVNFIAKFGISRKLVTVLELHEIFDLVENAFKCLRNFPSNFKLQFMHKDVNELIDLDSPIQLYDRANNCLLSQKIQLLLVNHQVMQMNLICRIIPCIFFVFM